METHARFIYTLLLAEKTAQLIADIVQTDLSLDAAYDALYLIIRQVNADKAFQCSNRIFLEFLHKVLVVLDLVGQFLDFCLDIHNYVLFSD